MEGLFAVEAILSEQQLGFLVVLADLEVVDARSANVVRYCSI